MNLEAVLIADHQQGRVLQVFPVIVQLQVGGAEITVFALVLPCEVAALPHVCKALAAAGGGDVLFKGVGVSGGIGGGGVRLAEHIAEVNEMGLRGGALRERAGLPAGRQIQQARAAWPITLG